MNFRDGRVKAAWEKVYQQDFDGALAILTPIYGNCGESVNRHCNEVRLAIASCNFFKDADLTLALLDTVTMNTDTSDAALRGRIVRVRAQVALQRGDMGGSEALLRQALDYLHEADDPAPRDLVNVHSDLAMMGLYNAEADIDAAAEATTALQIAGNDTQLRIEAIMVRAIIATAVEDDQVASERGFRQAIDIALADTAFHSQLGGLYHNLSTFYSRQDQFEEALVAIEMAIESDKEYIQEGLKFAVFQKANILNELGRYAAVVELANESIRHYGEGNWYLQDAFAYLDTAKTLNLNNVHQVYGLRAAALLEIGDSVQALADHYAQLDVRDALRARSINEVSQQYWSRQHKDDFDRAVELLIQLGRPWEALFFSDRVKSTALLREYERRRGKGPVAVPDSTFWQRYAARERTDIVAYHVGRQTQLYFHLAPSGRLEVQRLDLTNTNLGELIGAFKESIYGSAYQRVSMRSAVQQDSLYLCYQRLGDTLAKLLLPATLATDKLLIIPDGALHHLPFVALPWGDGSAASVDFTNQAYLGDKIKVRFDHGLAQQARHATRENLLATEENLIAFAPSFAGSERAASTLRGREDFRGGPGLPPLLHNLAEVEAIADVMDATLLVGEEASLAAFLARSAQALTVHVSSHGVVNATQPGSSFIAFRQTTDTLDAKELLFYEDLSKLNMLNEMVVLSACETSLGKVAPGEGVLSIGNAFTAAGVRTTVSSRWQVDDEATKEFMVHFYEALARGEDRSVALFSAQTALRQDNRYTHPYYWAGFLIQGADGVIKTATVFNWNYFLLFLGAISLAILAAYVLKE